MAWQLASVVAGWRWRRRTTAALAEHWRGARAGDGASVVSLGNLYATGRGVSYDPHAAAQWYRKGAEAGDTDGMAALARCYASGIGLSKDLAEARKWYDKPAAHGSDEAQAWLRPHPGP